MLGGLGLVRTTIEGVGAPYKGEEHHIEGWSTIRRAKHHIEGWSTIGIEVEYFRKRGGRVPLGEGVKCKGKVQ